MSALPFSWGMYIRVAKVSPCARLGIQVGELFANGSNHLYIEPCADIMGEHRDILS